MNATAQPIEADETGALESIKRMFGSAMDKDRVPIIIQAGLDSLDLDLADTLGLQLQPDNIEMATLQAHEQVVSALDSVAVALVSIAAVTSCLDMPAGSRSALESIIQLNVAMLEQKFLS